MQCQYELLGRLLDWLLFCEAPPAAYNFKSCLQDHLLVRIRSPSPIYAKLILARPTGSAACDVSTKAAHFLSKPGAVFSQFVVLSSTSRQIIQFVASITHSPSER